MESHRGITEEQFNMASLSTLQRRMLKLEACLLQSHTAIKGQAGTGIWVSCFECWALSIIHHHLTSGGQFLRGGALCVGLGSPLGLKGGLRDEGCMKDP